MQWVFRLARRVLGFTFCLLAVMTALAQNQNNTGRTPVIWAGVTDIVSTRSGIETQTDETDEEETLKRLPPARVSQDERSSTNDVPGALDSTDLPTKRKKRLVAGGGLLLSFDINGDSIVNQAELQQGILDAFSQADINQDDQITALEQADWVQRLPYSDASLANPVRFDPNLDYRVSKEEFTDSINQLFSQYANSETGTVRKASLFEYPPRREKVSRRIRNIESDHRGRVEIVR